MFTIRTLLINEILTTPAFTMKRVRVLALGTMFFLGFVIVSCAREDTLFVLSFAGPPASGKPLIQLRLVTALGERDLQRVIAEKMPLLKAEISKVSTADATDEGLRIDERKIFRLLQPEGRLQSVQLEIVEDEQELNAEALEILRKLPGNLGYAD